LFVICFLVLRNVIEAEMAKHQEKQTLLHKDLLDNRRINELGRIPIRTESDRFDVESQKFCAENQDHRTTDEESNVKASSERNFLQVQVTLLLLKSGF